MDEAPKLPPIRSNEWPDFASYLTETSGVFTRYSARNRRGLEGAVLKRVPSAERSVMRSVLQHTKTRAAYACRASHRALNQMDDFVAV